MRQAIFAEQAGAGLGVFINAGLPRVASPGSFQPLADLVMGEADHSCFVEVIDDLAVQPVALNRHRIEITLLQQRAHQVSHVVLGGLQGEEGGRVIRAGKAGCPGDQGPKQIDHAPRQAAHGDHVHQPAGNHARGLQRQGVGGSQRALRYHQQDISPGDTARHQV